ncbi:MAG: serine/threonine protein kinase [Oscillospiraceae bacterium]|nr:serine/threonine protein kinase [Oscillospiraceae bacterium]
MFNEMTLPYGYKLQNWDYSYIIDNVQGQGGFGITYSAHRAEDNLHVAVKEFFPNQLNLQRASDGTVHAGKDVQELYQGGMNSFLDEAKALAKLRNLSSVVKAYSYFQANGTAYLVMEFIEGTSLKSLLRNEGPVSAEEFLPKFRVLLEGIEKMHKTGLLHRDIAPDNIMLDNDGNLKLIDFGSARSMEDGRSAKVLLKPGFAPVEQYMSRGQGTYTDVYGISASIYYCLTGKVPPEAMSRLDNDPLVPPNQYGAGLTERQQEVLLRGLAVQPPTAKIPGKNPRYRTVGEFIRAFPWEDTQKPLPPIPGPTPIPEPEPEPIFTIEIGDRKKPTGSSGNIVLIICAVVFGIIFIAGFCAMCEGSFAGAVFALGGLVGLVALIVSIYRNSKWKG